MEGKLGYSPGEIALFTSIIFFIAFMLGIFVAENLHNNDFNKGVCQGLNGEFTKNYDGANYVNGVCVKDNKITYKF